MAKIKRVFVVEGIDDGAPISKELIQEANRLLEDGGLDVASTARSAILTDLLGSGTSARVLAFMSPSDISGVYSQPGGVSKFIDSAMSTPADVTKVLQMLNGKLPTGATNWLQQMPNKRMSIEDINGPEDAVVMLNVPKNVFNYTKINTPEEAKKKLQEILAHTHFKLHLNVHEAKAGLDPTELNATSVNQQLLDKFNFEAISGYTKKDTRVAAVAEWKKAKQGHAARKKDDGSIESPAHEFADWIEEYRLEHRLPKTESAAYEFYFKAKAKLDALSQGNPKLRRAAREAGVKMVKPDSGLWEKLATGDIDGYMKVIKARADAAGETLPKDDKPAKKPADEPEADNKKDKPSKEEHFKEWGLTVETDGNEKKFKIEGLLPDGNTVAKTDFAVKMMKVDDTGNVHIVTERGDEFDVHYDNLRASYTNKPFLETAKKLASTEKYTDKKDKALMFAIADLVNGDADASSTDSPPSEGSANLDKMPTHVQGALSSFAKSLKKIAKTTNVSTKDLLAAINKEIDSPD